MSNAIHLRVAAVLAMAGAAHGAPSVRLPGAGDYVAVRDLARVYNAPHRALPARGIALTGARHSLQFEADGRRIRLQGVEVWLQHPLDETRLRAGGIHRADAAGLVDVIFRPYLYLGSYAASTVVLDPGHGGRDGGAVGINGLLEKDLTLELAKAVRARLAVAGIKVVLTREDDRFLSLEERPRLAAAHRADLFVSLHFNAAAESGARGIETYVLARPGIAPSRAADPRPSERYRAVPANAHDAANFALGFHVQRQTTRTAGARDRGVRHARFAVLRPAPCPAALIECGFLSDDQEARQIARADYRERLAEGVARGILEYAVQVRRARAARMVPP